MKIKVSNVSYTYKKGDKLALEDINLEFNGSEVIFIMGASGSGKSTLIQHLNGLLFPCKGKVEIEIDGKTFLVDKKEKNMKELRKQVGLVFQFPENQLFESSVLKDVMFGPKNFGYSNSEAEKLAKGSLTLMGIGENYYNRSPFDLSGGEKRKVALAGVIASKPKILVLDEPTSSLDNKSTQEFFKIVERLKEKGVMVIVVTHDVDLCYEYADKVVILSKGKVAYFGDYNNAFNNEEVLKSVNVEKPFVLKAKERLLVEKDVRSIAQLVEAYREESQDE